MLQRSIGQHDDSSQESPDGDKSCEGSISIRKVLFVISFYRDTKINILYARRLVEGLFKPRLNRKDIGSQIFRACLALRKTDED